MSHVPVGEEVPTVSASLRNINCGRPDADALGDLLDHPASLGFWEQAEGWELPAVSSACILDSTADFRPGHQDLEDQRLPRCIANDCSDSS